MPRLKAKNQGIPSKTCRPALKATQPSFNGDRVGSLGVEWPGLESDTSSPSNAEVKNE